MMEGSKSLSTNYGYQPNPSYFVSKKNDWNTAILSFIYSHNAHECFDDT